MTKFKPGDLVRPNNSHFHPDATIIRNNLVLQFKDIKNEIFEVQCAVYTGLYYCYCLQYNFYMFYSDRDLVDANAHTKI